MVSAGTCWCMELSQDPCWNELDLKMNAADCRCIPAEPVIDELGCWFGRRFEKIGSYNLQKRTSLKHNYIVL